MARHGWCIQLEQRAKNGTEGEWQFEIDLIASSRPKNVRQQISNICPQFGSTFSLDLNEKTKQEKNR